MSGRGATFCGSSGNVTDEVIKAYIAQQSHDSDDVFRIEGEASPDGDAPIVSGSIFAWWWSFQIQAVNMRDQFSFRGPSTEVETQHLICPLRRGFPPPTEDR